MSAPFRQREDPAVGRVPPGRRGLVERLPAAVRLLGLGWYVAFCIVAGTVGGVAIDSAVETSPLFTLLGIFLGLIAAFGGGYILLVRSLGMGQPPKQKDG